MPAPEALTRLIQDPHLLAALLTDSALPPGSDAGPGELRICLPLAGGYGFVLQLDPVSGEQTLGLRGPATSEPVRLADAYRGQPAPAALTVAELDLCARVIALEDPWLPHPGPVVALLSRFAAPPDGPADRAVLRTALRSLRYDVPPAEPAGPEQAPLPLFADEAWWPRGPQPSGRVLDDGQIEDVLAAPSAGAAVRGTERFPAAELAEAVRLVRARLDRLPREPGCADRRVLPVARRIAGSGDLAEVSELLAALTEAGCDHPTVLDALSEPLEPVEACWMVETLAGAARGSALHRHLAEPAGHGPAGHGPAGHGPGEHRSGGRGPGDRRPGNRGRGNRGWGQLG